LILRGSRKHELLTGVFKDIEEGPVIVRSTIVGIWKTVADLRFASDQPSSFD
jgi:hypothetical protein